MNVDFALWPSLSLKRWRCTNLFGGDDSRAVGTHQSRLALADEGVLHLHHVVLRHTLRNANDQGDLRFQSLDDGGRSARWWHIDDGGMWIGGLLGLRHRSEDGQSQMLGASLLGGNAADQLGAVLQSLLAVERALFAGESLADHPRIAVQLQVAARLVVLRIAAHSGHEAI